VRVLLGSCLLLAACGGEPAPHPTRAAPARAPELDGTWESERTSGVLLTIAGDRVTMTVPGLQPASYEQAAEQTASGYLLRWRKEDGEVLRVEARRDGDRLLLAFEGQEFALRRAR
jgi:hypothetical protein